MNRRIAAEPAPAAPNYRVRYRWVQISLVLLALAVVGRLLWLHVVDSDFLRAHGEARSVRVEKIAAHRGIIRDRNGEPLAISTPVTSLWVNPSELNEAGNRALWPRIAQATGVSLKEFSARLQKNHQREFMYLSRHMAPVEAEKILAMKLPGVNGMTEYRRYYPESEAMAHLLGFTGLDDEGKEGVELAYDAVLGGEAGSKRVVKDLKGHLVRDVDILTPAHPGQDITLSFDKRAQYLAFRELSAQVTEHQAQAGSAVALDVQTGEVIAMVNLPSYNPNNRAQRTADALRNRALTDVFEPGSTVKPFTVYAGLASGKYQPNSHFDTTPGVLHVGSKLVRDHESLGVIDMTTLLTKSSNVAAAQIALSLPAGDVARVFRQFGLGEKTGSGFPGERSGVVPERARWAAIETATLGFGYGLETTALQLAQAYSVLASGGIKRPVSFLKVNGPVPGVRVADEKLVDAIVPMLETVTTDAGTASRARVPGYRIAGKTGTVHKAMAGGYSPDQYRSLFVGLAPVSNPRIVLAIVIDTPRGGEYYGGLVSAPAFSRIMAELLRIRSVEPDRITDHLLSSTQPVAAKAAAVRVVMPGGRA